jgi:hypothetical protein
MKKIISLFLIMFAFLSCKNEVECCVNPTTNVTLKFTHNWDGTPLTSSDFNDFKFTTENGESLSINRLRYLLSNIRLINGNDIYTFSDYNLIDLESEKGLSLSLPQSIFSGSYELKFNFGFADVDNKDGVYQDLNSVSFDVPGMLGGGYHYMQFDGKYKDVNNADAGFNYHTIRAVNRTDPTNLIFEDTSFEVDLGTLSFINNAEITIKADISEWFKNPNTWNLNELNTVLMPNFEAQKLMSANGKSVFSLGEITQ